MEWITRSSLPVMKVAGTGSGLASSNVSGSDGLGTGGGGTGGTTGLSDLGQAHRRRARDAERAGREGRPSAPAAASALSPPPLPFAASVGWRADLLERVQLAVVVLDGMDVVVRAPDQEDGRE